MSSQLDDSHENHQAGVQDDQAEEHSVYYEKKLARARRSYKLAQVSLNLQDRLGLAKIRYEQRYSKPSSEDNETAPSSESIQNAAAAVVPKSESETKTTPSSADAASGTTIIIPKSFSSPMIKDDFSDPFYYHQHHQHHHHQQSISKYPPMLHSHTLQEIEAAAAAAAATIADPNGVSEDRRRGPFLYSDPFRHSREAPMPNPWTHKWAFSASQYMASLPPFSSPTEHRYMRRHQSYPNGNGNSNGGGGGGGWGRRWTYDHTDGIRERDTAVLHKNDPMLPSVPAFGVVVEEEEEERSRRRPSECANSMNVHCSSTSPRTPPPKRQRTAPIAPGKPPPPPPPAAAGVAGAAGGGGRGENGADLLLYLANSPQGSSSTSSSGYPSYSKHTHPHPHTTHTHTHAPYIHPFTAPTAPAYHPYASSMHHGLSNLSNLSSDIPSTPPSRHHTTTITTATAYATSSSLYSTPLPSSSTIPTTPLSRLTSYCGHGGHGGGGGLGAG
ncbi:adenylosuccinase ade13, partial [Ascosphaera pollenicola]